MADFVANGVKPGVLIPILMDYPLGAGAVVPLQQRIQRVLIPILMDYPLGAKGAPGGNQNRPLVLIPILMDYPLGAGGLFDKKALWTSLNPYSNGLPSRGQTFHFQNTSITRS